MKKYRGPLKEKRSLERKGNNVGRRPKQNILRSKRKLKRDVAKAKKEALSDRYISMETEKKIEMFFKKKHSCGYICQNWSLHPPLNIYRALLLPTGYKTY